MEVLNPYAFFEKLIFEQEICKNILSIQRIVISLSVEHSAWKISCSFLDFSSFRSVTLALSFFLTVLYLFSIGFDLYMFVASDSESNLPVFPILHPASMHDSHGFLNAFSG